MKYEETKMELTAEDSPSSLNGIAPGEIIIGELTGLDDQGNALVNFSENPSTKPLIAITTVALHQKQSGRQVALLFAEGDIQKPVIIGLIHNPLAQMLETFEMVEADAQSAETEQLDSKAVTTSEIDDVTLDGNRVVLEGKEEIVLKCGDASITLTKAGKILIRGKYLLNRSTGVNRIMGGSVQVN